MNLMGIFEELQARALKRALAASAVGKTAEIRLKHEPQRAKAKLGS